jgi:hypothetical protein
VVGGEGRIRMSATSETLPGIRRSSTPGTGRVLEGLAAGTWDVRIEAHDVALNRSISVDGVTDVTLDLSGE